MNGDSPARIGRRRFLGTAAVLLGATAAPAFAQQGVGFGDPAGIVPGGGPVARNISSFSARDWQPYFDNTRNGAILVDINSRAVHYWNDDQSIYRLYPSSIPLSEDLTRRGRTNVTLKDPSPDWRPTPAMKVRNPEWPDYIEPGPDNPLGTRALHLSWQYYRIHGTHDTRKIGRRSSNGCIGLYNEHIEELYGMANVGTQVLVI
jgi:lipoprotein-anchoring transpeptidase ErfK/SrfK